MSHLMSLVELRLNLAYNLSLECDQNNAPSQPPWSVQMLKPAKPDSEGTKRVQLRPSTKGTNTDFKNCVIEPS